MESQYPQLFQLDIPTRLQLVEDLWDSIAADSGAVPMQEWQIKEIERRWAEHLANPSLAIPIDEAMKRLRQGGS